MNYCSVALFPFSEVGECLDKAVFVQNIKKYCAAKGVKPTVACRESGVGSSFINNIESRGQVPSVEKVQLLAQYLGVTVGELLGEDPSKSTNGPPRPYLVFRFNQLSPKSQEDVMAFVEYRWVQDQKEKADEEPKPHKILKISPSAGNQRIQVGQKKERGVWAMDFIDSTEAIL